MVNVIDYVPGTTLLHKLNPVAKLALAAAIILSTFLAQSYAMLIGLLALTLALGAYAGVVDRLLKLLRLLIPIALIMLVLQTAFMREGETLFAFVTDTGLITGSKACLRLLGSTRRGVRHQKPRQEAQAHAAAVRPAAYFERRQDRRYGARRRAARLLPAHAQKQLQALPLCRLRHRSPRLLRRPYRCRSGSLVFVPPSRRRVPLATMQQEGM